MNLKLEGKLALVSGSTAGIGRAIAESLALEGAEVIVNGRTEERVNAALEEIRRAHPQAKARGMAADLGTAAGVATLLESLPSVDILVNNVGIFEPKEFEQIPDEDWLRMFEVNVMSGVRLTRAFLAGMKARDWGRVIIWESLASRAALATSSSQFHSVVRPEFAHPVPSAGLRRWRPTLSSACQPWLIATS